MDIKFNGLPSELNDGMAIFLDRYAKDIAGSLNVNITFSDEKRLVINRNGDNADITVTENVNIFRAMSQLLINSDNKNYQFDNKIHFDFNGVMYDFAQANAFLSVNSTKELIRTFAAFGLNKFLLYIEDCMEIEGEPYFGYLRPKYTEAELRELDDYAYSFGIELIPCIQSLAHLQCLVIWDDYRVMSDNEKVLLVGDERVYTLVEKMITTIMRPLRTKTIHLGLDEAWKLGQGEYLAKNGYRPKIDIFSEHVQRVKEITDRLGYYPLIWNDMYFRANANEIYYLPPDVDITLDGEHMPPEGMGYVYWDYDNEPDYVEQNMKKHQKLFDDLYYAGACATGASLAFKREYSVRHTNGALSACKKNGQRKVFCTVWGDNVREVPPYAVLNGIIPFAEHCYNDEPDAKETAQMFKFAVGIDIEDFDAMSDIDIVPNYSDKDNNYGAKTPSRHLLYQDVMYGMFDVNFENCDLKAHFASFVKRMQKAYDNTIASVGEGMYSDMFNFYIHLGSFLELKADIGRVIHQAYKNNDKAMLKKLVDEILPEAISRGEKHMLAYKNMYFRNFKGLGIEIFDIRNGGVIARLKTAKFRIENYLNGTGNLEELDEELLLFDRKPTVGYEFYTKYFSPSFI